MTSATMASIMARPLNPSQHSMVYRWFRIGLKYIKTDINVYVRFEFKIKFVPEKFAFLKY